jgi:hypothetical protein
MRTSKSELIHTVCPCSKCCAMFLASSSLGVMWMNYICLVLSVKMCGSVPSVPHTSLKCVVLFLQSLMRLRNLWCCLWFCSSSPSHIFDTCGAVCGPVPPVSHASSTLVVLFVVLFHQSLTRLQSVWCLIK